MLNELITSFTAALPLSELRGAIPLAILKFGFSPYKAFALSILGNILPVLPLLLGLEKISEYLSHKFYWFNRFFSWLFERVRIKHSGHFIYWGDLALLNEVPGVFYSYPKTLRALHLLGGFSAFYFCGNSSAFNRRLFRSRGRLCFRHSFKARFLVYCFRSFSRRLNCHCRNYIWRKYIHYVLNFRNLWQKKS